MKDNTIKSCMAIACLTAIELFALYKGINGAVFGVVVALISGLGGYTLAKVQAQKQEA